ncbi:DUF350 domain-containing protein [Alsobacter sp. KACC 23698]|uniref:DUF350 domain-containing protein n=1 Tax=Alsobacter sp. KACC 23698 TaxID=3149229 RepID=A0AAU7JLT9_9HYPH
MLPLYLQGLPPFVVYALTSAALVCAFGYAYTRATAHDEFDLIREGNAAAAVSLGMSMLGFALPLSSAIVHAASVLDCIIWGLIALVVQVLVYFLARLPIPDVSRRIAAGEMASAVWLGSVSLVGGVVNAACMAP